MEKVPSADDLQRQIRFHEGQSQWNRWTMRTERLAEWVDTLDSWNENEDITGTCPTVALMLASAKDAHAAATKKLESLAEFAPQKKGKTK